MVQFLYLPFRQINKCTQEVKQMSMPQFCRPAFRFAAFLLALLLLLPAGASASQRIEEDCGQSPCVCFLQEGDEGLAVEGVIKLLRRQGYLSSSPSRYTADVTKAVKALQRDYGLSKTGTLDDDTLSCLIWGMTADELSDTKPRSSASEVWVPTNGGKKRHRTSTCSGMNAPRKMSARNAEALGLEPCKKCKPD